MSQGAPNREQIEYWNGPRGDFWVREQELRDRELACFGESAVSAAAPASGERVVDVGCGCGGSTLLLAEAVGAKGSVLGVDVSKPMLARATTRAAAHRQVRFELADAATYAFDGSAEIVFSRFGVMFFDDPVLAFQNLRRALSASGRLAFGCWGALEENDWMRVAFEALRPLITPARPLPLPHAPGPLAFADSARVRSILEQSPFRHVQFKKLEHPMPLGGNRGLDAAAEAALTAARRALEPYVQGERVELKGAAWLVTARAS